MKLETRVAVVVLGSALAFPLALFALATIGDTGWTRRAPSQDAGPEGTAAPSTPVALRQTLARLSLARCDDEASRTRIGRALIARTPKEESGGGPQALVPAGALGEWQYEAEGVAEGAHLDTVVLDARPTSRGVLRMPTLPWAEADTVVVESRLMRAVAQAPETPVEVLGFPSPRAEAHSTRPWLAFGCLVQNGRAPFWLVSGVRLPVTRPVPSAPGVADTADAPWRATWEAMWPVLALALLVALFVAGAGLFFVRRGMHATLSELREAVQRVEQGDLESTLGLGRGGQIDALRADFNRMNLELRQTQKKLVRAERIAAWKEIARRIAHEIKNPLSPIQVSIETLRKTHKMKHPDFEEIFEESTTTVLEEVNRMKRIVSEFSKFARMPRPLNEEVSLDAVLRHVTSLPSGAQVTLTTAAVRMRGDREQLTQAFLNLVQNAAEAAAARHGEAEARVEVRVTETADMITVQIDDNGPGVPEHVQERIFDPYFSTKATGSGLGLAIALRIVEEHGGGIALDASPESGARFTVTLDPKGPAAEASATLTGRLTT